ncbi:MAG: glycosyltransferase, partial [Lachnospiraceae bacterium]|nr:glycosyltransferase [Lachnospiraceae bacterium]
MKTEDFFKSREVDFEIIYVNDGSRDGTVREVKKLHERDERVHLIDFSRNFGKEAAIYAGLQRARGDFAVMLDCDLQD